MRAYLDNITVSREHKKSREHQKSHESVRVVSPGWDAANSDFHKVEQPEQDEAHRVS